MKTPKDRARHPNRRYNPHDEAPEGWYNLTPETMDEMDKAAEKAHLDMADDAGTVNLLDKSTWTDTPPF
jgi:hypothetical protein